MATEYLSRQRFPGDGVTTDFEVNFAGGTGDNQQGTHPYVDITDVKAYEVVPGEGANLPEAFRRDIVVLGPTSFRVAPAVAAGRFLEIRRETEDRYALVDFKTLQTVSAFDLDLSNRQLLYVVQEAMDGTRVVEEGIAAASAAADSAYREVRDDLAAEAAARQAADAAEKAARQAADAAEKAARQAADAALQAQVSGGPPLTASAFSPISWHDQIIPNSVMIPPGKNAWSFGPTMTIAPGQRVDVSGGSYWTIANGTDTPPQ